VNQVVMSQLAVSLLGGTSLGIVFFLIAAGLSLVMGLMGIVNLAHGHLVMLGAYLGVFVAKITGSFSIGILAGTGAAALVGLGIERGFLRGLYKKSLEQILVTFGFVYIITNVHQWVYGAKGKAPFVPALWSGTIHIGEYMFPVHRLIIMGIGVAIYLSLWWLQDRTKFGAIVRAGMDDKEMVSGLGINLTPIMVRAFLLGSAIAGFAGVAGSPLLGGLNIELGMSMLMTALAVCIVGGVGSIHGAMVGALIIGIATVIATTYYQPIAMFIMYIAMTVVLMFRPWGLLGRKF